MHKHGKIGFSYSCFVLSLFCQRADDKDVLCETAQSVTWQYIALHLLKL